jgi:hypothetical protein
MSPFAKKPVSKYLGQFPRPLLPKKYQKDFRLTFVPGATSTDCSQTADWYKKPRSRDIPLPRRPWGTCIYQV